MKSKSLTQRSLAVLLTTILLLVAIPVASVFAATTGPNYPGTAATDGGTGDAWFVISGTVVSALGADGGTTVNSIVDTASENLNMTNFGFSIPTDATINGISVEMNRYASNSGDISDVAVRLFKAGVLTGDNKAAAGTWATDTTTVVTYGGASDLWGTTWTPAQINASDFGVTLDVSNSDNSNRTATVDYVRITVTYTPAATATTTTVTSSVNPSTFGGSVTFTATVTSTSTPTGSVNFVIDGGSPVAGTAGATTATTATWTYTTAALTAGSHTVQANYTASGLFSNSSGTLSGGQTVNKATPNCSSIAGYSVTYDASAHTATGTCQGVAGEGTLAGLDLSATTHTNAGTYIGDLWTFTAANSNYNNANGTVNSSIGKANANCTIAGYSVTYDAASHTATGSCVGVGGDGALSGLDLTSTTHTAAGTYNNDPWTFSYVNSNYNNTGGTVDSSIAKANPSCTINSYSLTYDAASHTSTGSCEGVGGDGILSGLDLSDTTHTAAGTYNNDDWTFTSANSNYNDAAGTVDNSLGKAEADCTVSGYSVTFDGNPHTATGSCVGVGGDGTLVGLDLSSTTHTAVGTYDDDSWAFTDVSGNYNNTSGTVDSVITAKLVPDLTASGGPFTYDATPHAATVTSTVAGTVSDVQYDGSTTVPTNAGTYAVTADFLPTDTVTYETLDNAAAGTITINKTNADCSSIAGYNVIFDGNPHTATGSCQGVGGDGTLGGLDLSATTHTAIGTYDDDPWIFTDSSGNYNNTSGTVDSVIFDGSAPVVNSVVRASANPSAAASVDFTVTFSEDVTGVDATDFSLTTSGIAGASVTGVSGSGSVYTVSVGTGFGNGTIRLDVQANGSILDAASNPLVTAFTTGESYLINKGADTTGVFRPGNGVIYLKNTNTSGFADIELHYGNPGDYPIVGDWDGNGTDTIGVYRNGTFFLRNSNTVGVADLQFAFGVPGDQPVAGDWDGDGVDTIGVYHNGQFQLRNTNDIGPANVTFNLGNPGDVGIAGDWNGDGVDTTGVFRPGNGVIYLKNINVSGFAEVELNYGIPGDKPVVGDWDGDGDTTIGVYRNGRFLLRNSNTVGIAEIEFNLGNPSDMPIAGNWDGLP